MTTTVLDICARALRAMGVLSEGQEPAGNKAADILQHFQDLINDLPLLRAGEWSETFLTSAAAYNATDGERIHTEGFAATITLPTTYEDECGNTKATQDLSRVQILGAAHAQVGLWVYSASNAAWARVDALDLADECPFGREDDAGLVAMLAVDTADEYAGQVSALTGGRATRAVNSFRARFYREVPVATDAAFLIMSDLGNRTDYAGLVD